MTNPDKNTLSAEALPPRAGEEMPDFAALREGKGLSLADLFAKTRISTKNLAALEQGDFAALPPPVYTKAYIHQYANLIEIDPQALLSKYDSYLKMMEDPRPTRKSEGPEQPPQGLRLRKPLWAVLVVLIAVIALSFFLLLPKGKQPNRSTERNTVPTPTKHVLPADPTTPVAKTAQPVIIPETVTPVTAAPQPATPVRTFTPSVQTNPLPSPQAGNAPAIVAPGSQKLTITAREATWIGIHIDHQEGQQVFLHPGDAVTYTGNQFKMDIGNAGGIDVSLQGKTLPPLGERGQVVHVTLP